MPEREQITSAPLGDFGESRWCELARRWKVDPWVMQRVWLSAIDYENETAGAVWIISGHRTVAQQNELRRQGRPTADNDRSTHLSCPATGVDVSIAVAPVRAQIWIWGRIVRMNGLRWGGDSKLHEAGYPTDFGHIDKGPRQQVT